MPSPGPLPARRFLPAVCLSGVLFLVSCAAIRPAPLPPAPPSPGPPPLVGEGPPSQDPFRSFPETVRQRAREEETRGDLRKALFLWKVVTRVAPADKEAGEKVRTLSDRLASAADAHFRKGVDRYNAGEYAAARREFLLVLANDPDHAGARDYLLRRLEDPDITTYVTREGDTLRGIAKERYNDVRKEEMIAYLNDIDRNAPLRPGTVLRLPVIGTIPLMEVPVEGSKDILSYPKRTDQEEAERLYRSGLRRFQEGDLDKAAADWEMALRFDPDHAKARKDLDRVRRMLKKLE